MSLTKEIQFKSFMPPGVVNLGSKTYVCPGWHEVPIGTTLKEVFKHWVQVKPKMEAKPTHTISEMVDSSTAGKQYAVTFDGRFWNCECAGFQFRKSCRHTNDIKTKHNIK